MTTEEKLSCLPSVDDLLIRLAARGLRHPRRVVVDQVRAVLAEMRSRILKGEPVDTGEAAERVEAALGRLESSSLRRVINATGVVLHTNLGRAPLAPFRPLEGYSNLEYDLEAGRRGRRDAHVGALIERLAGAPGIVVNNNAAAIYLALNELASGGEVIVSRGELIEIGDGFRIPDIMRASGAVLREIGATNRTRIEDYLAAINDRTRLLLRVHPSNFRITGFTAKPRLEELTALGRERGLPVYEDLGSGCVVDMRRWGVDEPLVSDSLAAGVDLVSFSGDKMLGGPQAGILAGKAELVGRLRRNPMFRALRIDKLITQSLEQTLRAILLERWECVPALAMIAATAEAIRERAERLMTRLAGVDCEIVEGRSVIGGGSTPDQSLESWLIAVRGDVVALESLLRRGDPPVIARIEDDRLLFDLRTVQPSEEDELASAVNRAWSQARSR